MIGCDPEFVLRLNRRFTPSPYLLPDSLHEPIGTDGDGRTGELRTSPAEHGKELFNKIETLLTELAGQLPPGYTVLAGSSHKTRHRDHYNWVVTTGGHLHFSNEHCTSRYFFNLLDTYLSIPTLFLESYPQNKVRRLDRSFGRPGDYRDQSWGIEYRLPPSWIITPRVAKIYLSLASLLHHTFNKVRQGRLNVGLVSLEEPNYFNAYCEARLSVFENELPWIKEGHYKLLRAYHERDKKWVRQGLGLLWQCIDTKWQWNESLAVQKSWRLKNGGQRPRGHLTVNTNDDFLSGSSGSLTDTVRELSFTQNLFVYGLRESRGNIIATNIPGFRSAAHEYFPDIEICGPVIDREGLTLGIGHRLRQELVTFRWEQLILTLEDCGIIERGEE